MKIKAIYQCECCMKEYKSREEALKCERKCLDLTVEEYNEYLELLKEEKWAFGIAANRTNDEVREMCHEAVRKVIEFQKKHNITVEDISVH